MQNSEISSECYQTNINKDSISPPNPFEQLSSWCDAQNQNRPGEETITRILFVSVIRPYSKDESSSIEQVMMDVLHRTLLQCKDPLDELILEQCTPEQILSGPYKTNPWLDGINGCMVFIHPQQESIDPITITRQAQHQQCLLGLLEGPPRKVVYLLNAIQDAIDNVGVKPLSINDELKNDSIKKPSGTFQEWSESTRILLWSEDCPDHDFILPLQMYSVEPLIVLNRDSTDKGNAPRLFSLEQVRNLVASIMKEHKSFMGIKKSTPKRASNEFGNTLLGSQFGINLDDSIDNELEETVGSLREPNGQNEQVVIPLRLLEQRKLFPSVDRIIANCSSGSPFPTWKKFKSIYVDPMPVECSPGDTTFPPWSWSIDVDLNLEKMQNTFAKT